MSFRIRVTHASERPNAAVIGVVFDEGMFKADDIAIVEDHPEIQVKLKWFALTTPRIGAPEVAAKSIVIEKGSFNIKHLIGKVLVKHS